MNYKPSKVSYRNKEYCVVCECPATKHCRCCGDPLCAFCAKHEEMCNDCLRDKDTEYVDAHYRTRTTQAY